MVTISGSLDKRFYLPLDFIVAFVAGALFLSMQIERIQHSQLCQGLYLAYAKCAK